MHKSDQSKDVAFERERKKKEIKKTKHNAHRFSPNFELAI